MYHAEQVRAHLRAQSTDLEAYYVSLDMVLEVRFADAFAIPRIAQLTQKTNQFNLTTRRYSDAEIKELSEQDGADVITLRLADRFGDAGLVGVCILRYGGQQVVFDTFLLSCRVLGRGVEDAFLVQCLRRARLRGCRTALGECRPTLKNAQVEDFYPRHGFELSAAEGTCRRFAFDLMKLAEAEPSFFKRIDSEIVAPAAPARGKITAAQEGEG